VAVELQANAVHRSDGAVRIGVSFATSQKTE